MMTEEDQISDAMRALRDADLSYNDLLHMAAVDWARGIQLKILLENARKELSQGNARRAAGRLAAGLALNEALIQMQAVLELSLDRLVRRAKTQQRNDTAAKGGQASHGETRKEKELIRAEWHRWQAGASAYTTKAEFARVMVSKSKHLKNTRTIENWCRTWEAEAKKA